MSVSNSIANSRLHDARVRRGLSLADAAKHVKLSKGYLSELEHGRKAPSLAVAMRIAAAYKTEPVVLWPESMEGEPIAESENSVSLGPLAMLSERQRIDLANALIAGTSHHLIVRSRLPLPPTPLACWLVEHPDTRSLLCEGAIHLRDMRLDLHAECVEGIASMLETQP